MILGMFDQHAGFTAYQYESSLILTRCLLWDGCVKVRDDKENLA